MKEENDRSAQSRPMQAGQKTVSFSKATADDNKLQDLIVEEGETIVLSYSSNRFKSFYQKIKPESIDHLKELIGVPKQFQETKSSIRQTFSTRRPGSSSVFKKSSLNLSARVFHPSVLTDDNSSEEEKIEAKMFARQAIEQYLFEYEYAYSALEAHRAIMEAYLNYSDATLVVPIFDDITVHNGATFIVANDTPLVSANNICLYGTGKIECDGPTTLHCHGTFKGNQPYEV